MSLFWTCEAYGRQKFVEKSALIARKEKLLARFRNGVNDRERIAPIDVVCQYMFLVLFVLRPRVQRALVISVLVHSPDFSHAGGSVSNEPKMVVPGRGPGNSRVGPEPWLLQGRGCRFVDRTAATPLQVSGL